MATSKGELIFSTDGGYGQLMNYVRDGKVVTRKRHNLTSKSATPDQLVERSLMGNVVHGYKAMDQGDDLHPSFPERKRGTTDYNMFVAMNRPNANIYLTKEQVELGYCVLDNWVISQGSLLPPVLMNEETGYIVSDICVGSLEVDEETTVVELSTAIVDNNGARFRDGDLLAYFFSQQKVVPVRDVPYVGTTAGKVNLSLKTTSTEKLKDITDPLGFSTVLKNGKRYLAIPATSDSMGTYVQTRIGSDDQVTITTEFMVGSNSLKSRFTTQEACDEAVKSYAKDRYVKKEFLRPGKNVARAGSSSSNGTGTGSGTGNTDPTTPQTAEIKVLANHEGANSRVTGGGVYEVGSTVTLTATSNSQWNFIRWSTGATTPTIEVEVPAGGATYTAYFENAE